VVVVQRVLLRYDEKISGHGAVPANPLQDKKQNPVAGLDHHQPVSEPVRLGQIPQEERNHQASHPA